jgi:hypothetical protein
MPAGSQSAEPQHPFVAIPGWLSQGMACAALAAGTANGSSSHVTRRNTKARDMHRI